jgi:putative endonuclease
MNSRGKLGRRGEDLAAELLLGSGYEIVERNWRGGQLGEIDLICRCKEQLVFVEVRLRRGPAFGTPEESITLSKKRRLIALADRYVQLHSWTGDCRIDVVAIELDPAGHLVRQTHIPNAVTGGDV